jgi:hypothetical protein
MTAQKQALRTLVEKGHTSWELCRLTGYAIPHQLRAFPAAKQGRRPVGPRCSGAPFRGVRHRVDQRQSGDVCWRARREVRRATGMRSGIEVAWMQGGGVVRRDTAAGASGAAPGGATPGGPAGATAMCLTAAYDLPDFRPALMTGAAGAVRADTDGNLWIRTVPTRPVPGGPVYDVVSPAGELVNRIQLPPGYTIVGFGRDRVVYLTMRDAAGLKLARVRLR